MYGRTNINEYTSRYISDPENFNVRAYHTIRPDRAADVFYDGCLDPTVEHPGECKDNVVWFSIKHDFDGEFVVSIELDKNTFEEYGFRWMNDIHLTTRSKIDLINKRVHIDKIKGVNLDNLFKLMYKGDWKSLDNFIDKVWSLTDYEVGGDKFTRKILEQYGFKWSDWNMYGDDNDESMDEGKKDKYVRQGIIPYGDGDAMMGESEERQASDVIYYGLFLDNASRGKLKNLVPKEAVKVFCDHMTMAFRTQFTPEIIEECESLCGEEFDLTATHIGMTDDVLAVRVDTDCFSVNPNKHITLCTLSPSGKPVQSNEISDWRELYDPVSLRGTVKPFMKQVRNENVQINEVEADDISLKSFEIQDELNPKFWINGKINSRVRLKLLDLADEFIDSLAVDWVKPKDIVLTGSIANYNWSKYSDVDVHILMDFKKIWKKTEFVQDYFDSKKALWSQEHDGLKIYGFPVEMYVEDVNNDNPSSGIYSLNKNKWLVEPNDFQDAELNEKYIKEQAARIMTKIDDIDDSIKGEKDNHKLEVSSTKLKNLFDKLHKQRQESLEKHGEMGTYNIIWKVLRRSGHLDRIWDIINTVYNKVNSIK